MDQREVWDDVVGDGWVRHADFQEHHSRTFGLAAIDALGPIEGADVLEVGCGTGSMSFELAARGAGSVLGLDLSTRMIAAAQRRLDAAPDPRIHFEAMDVTTAAPTSGFDVVYSRFGVMFFADPVGGFRALRDMTRPGGHLGFACWRPPFDNPWMLAPVMASFEVLGPPELPGPGEPGPFSLANEEDLHTVLGAAGWQDIEVRTISNSFPFDAGGPEATASAVMEINPVLGLGLRKAPEKADELRSVIAATLALHQVDGVITFGSVANIVTATA